jgi:hypothetical protein
LFRQSDAKVLVIAVERKPEVSLLFVDVKMTIRPQPVGLPPKKSLSGFDARRSSYVDRSSTRFRQKVLETKEGKGRRFDLRSTRPMQQAAVKAQHSRLLRRDVQLEGRQPLFHFPPKSLRVFSVLERRHEVVGVPGEFRPFSAVPLEAPFKPQVQDIVQIHVRQHG